MGLRRQQCGEFLLFTSVEFLALNQTMITALQSLFFLLKMLQLAFQAFLADEDFFLQTLQFKLRRVGFLIEARLGLVPRGLGFEGGLALLALGLLFRFV